MRGSEDFPQQILDDRISSAVYRKIKPLFDSAEQLNDSLFTIKSLAKYLKVSEKWIKKRISRKEIPVIKIDKVLRFRKPAIDQWLDAHKISIEE